MSQTQCLLTGKRNVQGDLAVHCDGQALKQVDCIKYLGAVTLILVDDFTIYMSVFEYVGDRLT